VVTDRGVVAPGYADRTVGTIMSTNQISLLVPCHRVVAADGLGGFGSVRIEFLSPL
jgi:methylated-DNA-[protein]-cysteine S-methyltransferase